MLTVSLFKSKNIYIEKEIQQNTINKKTKLQLQNDAIFNLMMILNVFALKKGIMKDKIKIYTQLNIELPSFLELVKTTTLYARLVVIFYAGNTVFTLKYYYLEF